VKPKKSGDFSFPQSSGGSQGVHADAGNSYKLTAPLKRRLKGLKKCIPQFFLNGYQKSWASENLYHRCSVVFFFLRPKIEWKNLRIFSCIKCRCRRKSFCNPIGPYDTFHSWCIYLHFPYKSSICVARKYTVRSMNPCGIQAINPLHSWRALWSPKRVVKSKGMNPPKMPQTPKNEGSNYQVHSSRRDLFVIPKIVGSVTNLTIPTKKQVTSRIAICIWVFWKTLGWFVKWHESVNRKWWKKRVQEKKSCTSWEVVINPIGREVYMPTIETSYFPGWVAPSPTVGRG